MNVIWTRLTENGRNWRMSGSEYVIENLVANGSEQAVDDIIEHTFNIWWAISLIKVMSFICTRSVTSAYASAGELICGCHNSIFLLCVDFYGFLPPFFEKTSMNSWMLVYIHSW
ncbi:hypothetical protein POM88_038889 [Heracleum sosnowskyi]|uniref:ENTH domain-containing protein n=1 Tax=Heracleum sosnowskyi TaxID=360622 RepID=A0AAD8HBS5_9APIA|nr:hypothetical protein POM88_038889 [Heracleum sosnowskyi]